MPPWKGHKRPSPNCMKQDIESLFLAATTSPSSSSGSATTISTLTQSGISRANPQQPSIVTIEDIVSRATGPKPQVTSLSWQPTDHFAAKGVFWKLLAIVMGYRLGEWTAWWLR